MQALIKRVAVDIDDCLSATMPAVLGVVATRGGPQLELEDITEWGFSSIVAIDPDKVPELFEYVWSNGHWKDIDTCEPDDVEQIDRLTGLADPSIVTSAGARQVEGKMRWLEYQWKKAGSQFKLPVTIVPYGMTKENLHYQAYVDDRAETIERAVKLGKIGILRDRPWNRKTTAGIRVYSMKEAVDALEATGRLK